MAFIIKSFFNDSTVAATVSLDEEISFSIDPFKAHDLDPNWVVPVATTAAEYASNHITVVFAGNTVPFTFWENGGYLYYSQSDSWNNTQQMTVIQNAQLQYQISEIQEKPWIVGETIDEEG
jgi:hypothetical protein